jgi:hypothetical protein
VKEIIIFLNHVRACMFIAGGVLGSCKRGTGRAKRDLDMTSGASLLRENYMSVTFRASLCCTTTLALSHYVKALVSFDKLDEREHAAQRGSSFYY